MDRLFVVDFSYGQANLARVEVIKETPKNYFINTLSKEAILGWIYLPERLSKAKYAYFKTVDEALNYLVSCACHNVAVLENNLLEARNHLEKLVSIREALDENQASKEKESRKVVNNQRECAP